MDNFNPQPARRGRGAPTVVCYVCSRQFGSKSIAIHEPQCLEKWRVANAKQPKHLRRPEPVKPELLKSGQPIDSETANQLAWEASQSNLVPCHNCGRTFNPDRLEVHQRACLSKNALFKPSTSEQRERALEAKLNLTEPKRDRSASREGERFQENEGEPKLRAMPSVFCYICSRQFGSKSIAIHEPQCLQKWHRENAKLPKHLRRKEPVRPTDLAPGEPLTREKANELAWATSQANLVPCSNCARTFNPDRLPVHQRSCRPKDSTAETSSRNDAGWPEEESEKRRKPRPISTVFCYICSRQFGSKSISIHEPQCLAKWHAANDKLPSHLRQPEPIRPQQIHGATREEANELAWQTSQLNLTPCEYCGRTLNPERLAAHQRSCTAEKPHKPAPPRSRAN